MNLRWLERQIPDSCKTEMVLQYKGEFFNEPWVDVPTEHLPKRLSHD